MLDQVFIYLIVALNTLAQIMLIRSLNFPLGGKRKYYVLAVAIPVLVMLSIRILIAVGIIEGRVAEQSALEQHVTTAASILLDKRRKGWLARSLEESNGPE